MAGKLLSHRLLAAAVMSGLLISSTAFGDDIIIGTGTSTWSYPLYAAYYDARTQTIYLASEISAPCTISSMSLYITTVPGQTMNNFTIRMRHTDLSVYGISPGWESTGWTTVYQANQTISTTGWVQFNFSAPFSYNGSQNLMVDISFNNSSYTSSGYCRYSTPGGTRSIYFRTNSGYGDPLTWSSWTPIPYESTRMPDIRLGVSAWGAAAKLAFSPGAGTYNDVQNVAVTCATTGVTIHYTTTGVDPNESDPAIASGGSVYIDHSLVLKAKAWKDGLAPSAMKSATYTLIVDTPAFSSGGGTYNVEQSVVVTCATTGATIHYTTSGADPTESDPVIASGGSVPATVVPATTLKARAWRSGWTTSDIQTAEYRCPIHVRTDGNDLADGLSWATAKGTLTGGLDAAVSGDAIWVAAGTYKPTIDYGLVAGTGEVRERLKHFRMKDGVEIYGGFAGTETDVNDRDWRRNVAILSGDIGVPGDASDNCYHVVYLPSELGLTSSARLDGFTITGGNANSSGSNYAHLSGGGLQSSSGNLQTVVNCIFLRNYASCHGGGMEFSPEGGVVRDCIFAGNTTGYWGGGLLGAGSVWNCVFVGNTSFAGGGMCFVGGYGWRAEINNCTFVGNTAVFGDAAAAGTYTAVNVRNCVLWGNGPYPLDGVHEDDEYSWYISSEYCTTTDPLFVRDPNRWADGVWGTEDDDYGDLRLRAGSPCVDAGSNAAVPAGITTDLVGNPRIFDGNGDGVATVDIGAYERQCVANPVGDVSYDCGVEFADYAMLMNWWGESCSSDNWWCYRADVNESGTVDIMDMAAMVEHWLEGI